MVILITVKDTNQNFIQPIKYGKTNNVNERKSLNLLICNQ